MCVHTTTMSSRVLKYWETVASSLYHPVSTHRRFHRFVSVWTVCVLFQVTLTVPMRWPALRVHTKVPVPCNMVLMQDWGALSWSLMVWLTVGMYGNSITDSKQEMFTDTPVTVPARCLRRRNRDQSVWQVMNLNVLVNLTLDKYLFLLRILCLQSVPNQMNSSCARDTWLWMKDSFFKI